MFLVTTAASSTLSVRSASALGFNPLISSLQLKFISTFLFFHLFLYLCHISFALTLSRFRFGMAFIEYTAHYIINWFNVNKNSLQLLFLCKEIAQYLCHQMKKLACNFQVTKFVQWRKENYGSSRQRKKDTFFMRTIFTKCILQPVFWMVTTATRHVPHIMALI